MLSASFHETFIPERKYLTEILKFAAKEKSGTLEEISAVTGIPMGQSSGKVQPSLHYAVGMGLIEIGKQERGVKSPRLTPLGRTLFLEDRNLSEKYSQWLLHLHLCNPFSGASAWHFTFSHAFHAFQNQLTRSQLEDFLQHHISGNMTRAVGPMLNMYQESASFSNTYCVEQQGETYTKNPLPIVEEYLRGYAALFFLYWDQVSPEAQQIVRDDFEAETYFFQLTGWDLQTSDEILEKWAFNNWINLDRQTEKIVITRLINTQELISSLFNDLI